ncbi:MAG: D-alanyl-D-alanine carboxypeptidase [Candidatus Magasanikbacteria bacterium]|jgi:serine-type D-Ala-D-Ala endopeptidase (penicillin-binding protein 7)|nr:D-alanyl-D-alanine carboxypeptidase [Candidatus Magasanikbacteria bacterium]
MKKNQFQTPISLLLAIAMIGSLLPIRALAAEFDPNFLISDEEMQDWDSMTQSDVQIFLDDLGGDIKDDKFIYEDGKKRTAADIIIRSSMEHKINPKYLLVKLQKEQSLITDKSASQKQLDWATGYGICDSCSKSDPDLQKYKGFGTQVNKAAGIIRWYYDNESSESWIKRAGQTYTIDGISVTPKTDATGYLYTYTPHIQGNKNFWTLWQRWFDQLYPDGTLMSSDGGETIYLIQDGEKRKFASKTAFSTRYDLNAVVTAPASEIRRYENGTDIALPNFSILHANGSYYLVDFDYLHSFESREVVRQLGYHPDEIVDVSTSELNGFTAGKIIKSDDKHIFGQLVTMQEDGITYFIDEQTLRPLLDDKIKKINYPHITPTKGSISDYQGYALGTPVPFKDGTLILVQGSNKVYVMEHGKKRHIASEDVFNNLGLKWDNIVSTSFSAGIYIEEAQPIFMRTGDGVTAPEPVAEKEEVDFRDIMQRTPEADTTFIGTEIETDIDAYLIAEYDSEKILAGKNVAVVRPLASLTKVMSAYRVMDEGFAPRKVTEYVPSAHKATYHRFRITEGEKIFNEDLLDASLISSINTATNMLVSSVEPNRAKFVTRMNQQADDWGMTDTTFVDATGEHEHNVSTASDYFTLFKKATKNRTIRQVLGSDSYKYTEFKDLDDKPDHFDDHSNDLMQKNDLPFTILSSKTGYLYDSGANIAMHVRRHSDSKEFMIITLGNVDFYNRFDEPERIARLVMKQFN